MSLQIEIEGAPPEGLAERITETIRDVTKLRGSVEVKSPGTLANDRPEAQQRRRCASVSNDQRNRHRPVVDEVNAHVGTKFAAGDERMPPRCRHEHALVEATGKVRRRSV